MFVENVTFNDTARFNVELTGGRVDISATTSLGPFTLKGVPAKDRKASSLIVAIRGSVFQGDFTLAGARDATVRINDFQAGKATFVDCRKLDFDGNKVTADTLVFRQTEKGRFGKTKILKCDIYSNQAVFDAPAGKKTEKCRVDKCWFKGLQKKRDILAKVIRDGRMTQSGVQVQLGKINKRPLELAGALER